MRKPEQPRLTQLVSLEEYLPSNETESDDSIIEIKGCHVTGRDNQLLVGKQIDLFDCLVESADLSLASFVTIKRWIFKNCKLRGTRLTRSLLKDILFDSCVLKEADFRWAEVKRLQFDDCDLVEVDFHRSNLKCVSFTNSRFSGFGFDQATINDVDVRTCQLEVIDPRTLKDVKISSDQVASISLELAKTSEIIVED